MKLTTKIKIIAVGRIKQAFLREGVKEYLQRLAYSAHVEIEEVKPPVHSDKWPPAEVCRREGAALLAGITRGEYVIALDPAGKLQTTEEWAAFFRNASVTGRQKITFVIGGEWGLGENVLKRADAVWSLSPLTFTHDMTRLIVLEQLYRVVTILQGLPYHK